MPDVTCVGVLAVDVIVRPVDEWPERGRLQLVEGIAVHSGGLAHTTAVTLAKLGVSTALVGRVGADPFGAFLIGVLREHGIAAHVLEDPEASTSATVVAVSSRGDRSFLHLVGANGRVIPDDVDDSLLARSRILHLGGYFILPFLDGEPASGLLRRAKAAGCRTSLDTAWDVRGRWMDALAPCLEHLDLLFGNREELARVTGENDPSKMTGALRQSGVEIVAVKLGEDGAFVEGDGWRGHVPAFAVPVVDTTGAGDAFCGGFLRGYLAGWNLEQTIRFANAVGGMCVTAVGGATGIRGTDETLAFMRQTRPRG